MPETYRALMCTRLEGPDALDVRELPVEAIAPDEVRVRVRAAGLGFPDLLMTRGQYQMKLEPPYVPGVEGAGEIIEIGRDVANWAIGDKVMFGGRGGAIAEQAVASITNLNRLPDALSFAEGACYRSGAVTALHALVDKGDIQAGQWALILGASGGVGIAAVQLAKHLGGRVIGTGSTPEKRASILSAGADVALDPADPDFVDQVRAKSGGGVDIVYDPVGGSLADAARRCLAWGGKYLIVGFASGTIPSFPANHALIKGYSILGLRAGESGRRDPELGKRNAVKLAEFASLGIMRPIISEQFELDRAMYAFRLMEARGVIGRVVIAPKFPGLSFPSALATKDLVKLPGIARR